MTTTRPRDVATATLARHSPDASRDRSGPHVNGHEVPPVGCWSIDPSHSLVEFQVRHLMIATVHGRFRVFPGTIGIGVLRESSAVAVSIGAASIDTDDARRDRALPGAHTCNRSCHWPERYGHTRDDGGTGRSCDRGRTMTVEKRCRGWPRQRYTATVTDSCRHLALGQFHR